MRVPGGLALSPGGAVVAAGRDASAQPYKARCRQVVTALKHADGISAQLLAGQLQAGEVATMDAVLMAPAAVRQQVRGRRMPGAAEAGDVGVPARLLRCVV